jgi:hypothetical protein
MMNPIADSSAIFQLGFVTSNMEEMMALLKRDYAVPSFFVFPDIQFKGVVFLEQPIECQANVAIGYSGDMQVEIVEPLGGADIYAEFLKSHSNGLHHIGIRVSDFDQVLSSLNERGVRVIESGEIGEEVAIRFAFADTRDSIGVITEYVWISEAMDRVYARLRKRAASQSSSRRTP